MSSSRHMKIEPQMSGFEDMDDFIDSTDRVILEPELSDGYTSDDSTEAADRVKLEPQLSDVSTMNDSASCSNATEEDSTSGTEEDLNAKIDEVRYQDKKRFAARLSDTREEIQKAGEFLQHILKDLLRPNSIKIPEFSDWIDDIDDVTTQDEMPRRVLGVMGDSGCGKSSLINALIGEDILPRSCIGEACTAVPVEVRYNTGTNENSRYRAIIHTITAEEWRTELELLVREVIDRNDSQCQDHMTEEAQVAEGKIQVVYPDVDIPKLTHALIPSLMCDRNITAYCGRKIEIAEPKVEDFINTIAPFIEGSVKKNRRNLSHNAAKWPLIKRVEILCRAEVLQTGLVLVDLPGFSDSNCARQMVAQRYLSEVSAICIVADIKRAITNAVAKDLHGRGQSLKRKLLQGGILDDEHTFFVLTMTDVIDIEEVIQRYDLTDSHAHGEISNLIKELNATRAKNAKIADKIHKVDVEISECRKAVKSWSSTRDQCQQRLRKRGSPGADSSKQPEETERTLKIVLEKISTVEVRLDSLETRSATLYRDANDTQAVLSNLEHQVTAYCIDMRNGYVRERVRADFRSGLQELGQELRDEEKKHENSLFHNPESVIRDGAQSFCVSTKAYQKCKQRQSMPAGFRTEEDTWIPQLSTYCREFTLGSRVHIANRLLEDVKRLKSRMRSWADNSVPDVQLTRGQRKKTEEVFRKHAKSLNEILFSSVSDCITELQQEVDSMHEYAIKTAIPVLGYKVQVLFNAWDEEIGVMQTWKAVCRKEGFHNGKVRGVPISFNWNQELADVLNNALGPKMATFRDHQVPKALKHLISKTRDAMEGFHRELEYSCSGITSHIKNSLLNFDENVKRHTVNLVRGIYEMIKKTMLEANSAGDEVHPKIYAGMKLGYEMAFKAKPEGKGKARIPMLQNSKNILSKYMLENSHAMYSEAEEAIREHFVRVITMLDLNLKKVIDSHLENIQTDFDKMLERASATPREEAGPEKVHLQTKVLAKLSEFDQVLEGLRNSQNDRNVSEAPPDDSGNLQEAKIWDEEPEIEEFSFESGGMDWAATGILEDDD